ncbi:hypothetical protein AWZ03_014592 [Drosophila navojoa]|uniref:Uncharacterized protein n=1 Tax=Drosophila navojoa TaxID=7232 RepID=A0A484ARC9_DRONA|nr:hypothetical protein AWZ03_014592 [Drosophila navojoa]
MPIPTGQVMMRFQQPQQPQQLLPAHLMQVKANVYEDDDDDLLTDQPISRSAIRYSKSKSTSTSKSMSTAKSKSKSKSSSTLRLRSFH